MIEHLQKIPLGGHETSVIKLKMMTTARTPRNPEESTVDHLSMAQEGLKRTQILLAKRRSGARPLGTKKKSVQLSIDLSQSARNITLNQSLSHKKGVFPTNMQLNSTHFGLEQSSIQSLQSQKLTNTSKRQAPPTINEHLLSAASIQHMHAKKLLSPTHNETIISHQTSLQSLNAIHPSLDESSVQPQTIDEEEMSLNQMPENSISVSVNKTKKGSKVKQSGEVSILPSAGNSDKSRVLAFSSRRSQQALKLNQQLN